MHFVARIYRSLSIAVRQTPSSAVTRITSHVSPQNSNKVVAEYNLNAIFRMRVMRPRAIISAHPFGDTAVQQRKTYIDKMKKKVSVLCSLLLFFCSHLRWPRAIRTSYKVHTHTMRCISRITGRGTNRNSNTIQLKISTVPLLSGAIGRDVTSIACSASTGDGTSALV